MDINKLTFQANDIYESIDFTHDTWITQINKLDQVHDKTLSVLEILINKWNFKYDDDTAIEMILTFYWSDSVWKQLEDIKNKLYVWQQKHKGYKYHLA